MKIELTERQQKLLNAMEASPNNDFARFAFEIKSFKPYSRINRLNIKSYASLPFNIISKNKNNSHVYKSTVKIKVPMDADFFSQNAPVDTVERIDFRTQFDENKILDMRLEINNQNCRLVSKYGIIKKEYNFKFDGKKISQIVEKDRSTERVR